MDCKVQRSLISPDAALSGFITALNMLSRSLLIHIFKVLHFALKGFEKILVNKSGLW